MSHLLSQIGVTSQKETQFLSRNIESIEDLAEFYPKKYFDFRAIMPVSAILTEGDYAIMGTVIRNSTGMPTKITVVDLSGFSIDLSVYGGSYLTSKIMVGECYVFCGHVSIIGYARQCPVMTTLVAFSKSMSDVCRLYPVYKKIKGMSDEYLKKKINEALSFLKANKTFSQRDQLATSFNLISRTDALTELHVPKKEESFRRAKKRLDFDLMYDFYENMYKSIKYASAVIPVEVTSHLKTDSFMAGLPFCLTVGQKETVAAIIQKAIAGERLNAIVTGDVGCGKTIVAIIAAVLMWENECQTAIMAPTLVLAKQHFEEFTERLTPLGIHIALLTSETKKKERAAILEGLQDGKIDVLIGTHSILSTEIQFKKLGLTIIDEEHKFGVKQKELLAEFDKLGAHHINMTATPIPRSFALSVYGDTLQVLPIADMPAGRKEIITKQFSDTEIVFEELYTEITAGHQAYLVTPFIEDSDSEAFKDIASVSGMMNAAAAYYGKTHPSIRIGSISGDMKQADILQTIGLFANGKLDLLISTTIIEVGVNVPNATTIAIMDADRFGLAALHQLRGRVGRKGDQGYCLLVSNKQSEKLDVLCHCSKGIEIAERDLTLRGPGDLVGDTQTGDMSARAIDVILRRPQMAQLIRDFLKN